MFVRGIVQDFDSAKPDAQPVVTWAVVNNVLLSVDAVPCSGGWEVTPIRRAGYEEPRERVAVMGFLTRRMPPLYTKRILGEKRVYTQGTSISFYEWFEQVKQKAAESGIDPAIVLLDDE